MDEVNIAAITTEADLNKYLKDTIALLTAVHREVATVLVRAREGDPAAVHELAARNGELEDALLRVMKAEQKLDEWNDRSTGHGARSRGGEIDFDAVRHEIGCRLARIRECCRSD